MFLSTAFLLTLLSAVTSQRNLMMSAEPSKNYERFNFFDTELLQVLGKSDKRSNLLISPLSIKTILAMILEGSQGRAATEILEALRLEDNTVNVRNRFYQILQDLQINTSTKVLTSSHIFPSIYYNLNDRYADIISKYYKTEITPINFVQKNEAASVMNSWVSSSTNRLIPDIVSSQDIDPHTQVVLTNVVYMKSSWLHKFDPASTKTGCFYVEMDRPCIRTNMMVTSGEFNYGFVDTLDSKILELPYKDERMSMIIVLPFKENGIRQLGRDLNHISMKKLLSRTKKSKVLVSIPKFTIEYNGNMIEHLKKLDIKNMFEPTSGLKNMLKDSSKTLQISTLLHKTKIIVDEEGSEAAAATSAVYIPLMGSGRENFQANHPFYFFIYDKQTQTILFAGRLSEPDEVREEQQQPQSATPRPFVINQVPTTPYVTRKPGTPPTPSVQYGKPNGFLPTETKRPPMVMTIPPSDDKIAYGLQVTQPPATTPGKRRTSPPPLYRTTTAKPVQSPPRRHDVRSVDDNAPSNVNDVQAYRYMYRYTPYKVQKRYEDRISFMQ